MNATVYLVMAMMVSAAAGCATASRPQFTDPTSITSTYLPLASLHVDTLRGLDGDDTLLIVRLIRTDATRTFAFDGKDVATLTMEDREYVNGELEEVTLDYFGQADDSAVHYFGEDVDEYEDGQVVGHSGAWLYGAHTQVLGTIMPGQPEPGQTFYLESVPGITAERDSVASLGDTVVVPAGTFTGCLRIQEDIGGGVLEYKYYAPGVGVVREVTPEGVVDLISHR